MFRDTAGQERFRTITTAYYRGAMVCTSDLILAVLASLQRVLEAVDRAAHTQAAGTLGDIESGSNWPGASGVGGGHPVQPHKACGFHS